MYRVQGNRFKRQKVTLSNRPNPLPTIPENSSLDSNFNPIDYPFGAPNVTADSPPKIHNSSNSPATSTSTPYLRLSAPQSPPLFLGNPNGPLLLILGHSWVKRIRDNYCNVPLPSFLSNFNIHCLTVSSLPRSFSEVQRNNHLNPSLVLVHLGGNDIGDGDVDKIKARFSQLFDQIYNIFPHTKTIITQIEDRFPSFPDYVGQRDYIFKANSKALNLWMQRQVSAGRVADLVLTIRGKEKLTNPEFYTSDGVHLNQIGHSKYLQIISSRIQNLTDCKNIPSGQTPRVVYCTNPSFCQNCSSL